MHTAPFTLRCWQVLKAVPDSVQGILVTAGGHGAAYCFRSANGGPLIKGFVPVLNVKVSDTTGAGDAFLSGFLYSMVKVRAFVQWLDHTKNRAKHAASKLGEGVTFQGCNQQ